MEILLTVVYTILFSFIIYRFKFFKLEQLQSWQVVALFWLKVVAGIGLYLIYSHYQNYKTDADIFKYFDDGNIMYSALWEKPSDYIKMIFGIQNTGEHFDKQYYFQMSHWYRVFEDSMYNDNRTVIRFNAIIRIFSFGCFNVHTVFFSFLSFAGLCGIYKFFRRGFAGSLILLVFAVFLIPSVLFWSSGVLKEAVLICTMGLFLLFVNKVIDKKVKLYDLMLFLLVLLVMVHVKIYVLMVLLPLSIAYILNARRNKGQSWSLYLLVLMVFSMVPFLIGWLFPDYNLINMIMRKQSDFINLANYVQSGSLIYIEPIEYGFWGVLRAIPFALFNTLLRPHFLDIHNAMTLASFIENVLIFAIIVKVLLNLRNRISFAEANLIWFSVSFVLILFVIIGITTPVLGAIVRYKVPALPFLMMIFATVVKPEKLNINPFKPKKLHE